MGINALLTADVQAAFLKGEFQDKDRVLHCGPPKNGPALPGVEPGSLLLILRDVFGLNDAPASCERKFPKLYRVKEATNVSWTIHAALSRRCVERCDLPSCC